MTQKIRSAFGTAEESFTHLRTRSRQFFVQMIKISKIRDYEISSTVPLMVVSNEHSTVSEARAS